MLSLAELYVAGVEPDVACLYSESECREFPLPSREEDFGGRNPTTTLRDELLGRSEAEQLALLVQLVCHEVAVILGNTDAVAIKEHCPFRDLGFDSVTVIDIRNRLSAVTGTELPATLAFDHPTPARVADFLRGKLLYPSRNDDPVATTRPIDGREPIAIVGMACRYPGGVNDPDELWQLVASGTDAVSRFPEDRGWDVDGSYVHKIERPGQYYQRSAGFLYDADLFDAGFFGVSSREALAMDPQQRLLLEVSWEALERAGIVPESLRASRTGVFVGAMTMDYGPRMDAGSRYEGYVLTGNTGSVASGRIAYVLGLEGPAITVDTACSSSLVALHMAAKSLRDGECDLALAGGVTVMSSLGMFMEFSRQGGLAPDGRCKAFSDNANGFGLAEGVGLILLERLSDARRLGHEVLAVVRGSAVNSDGASNGLTAPNGPSQQR
ncbi:MAG: type I polyketide synthase, partial [Kutzneria sp.]|nr:type I polyketide synthase [Kutzneria sp.]